MTSRAPTITEASRTPRRRVTTSRRRVDDSTAVALLVLLSGAAPALVVPADPLAGRGIARPRLTAARAVPSAARQGPRHRVRGEAARHDGPDGLRPGRRARGGGSSGSGARGRRSGSGRSGAAGQARHARGEVLVDRRCAGGRLAGDRDPEDRRRDLVADQIAQLAVEMVGLATELVERVLLGVTAEADAPPHVVDLSQVFDPQ